MRTNGTMEFGCRTIWAASSDVAWNELRYDSNIQMDGKRFDETNQRKPLTDRTYHNKTYRQLQAGKGTEQIIFREGCYYA